MMAIRKTSPRNPTTMALIAIAAGPAMNFKTKPNKVKLGPHEITFS
jgi:hypothetical protein